METSETVAIVVNGEAKQAPHGATVRQLLEILGLDAGRVAIERNLEILARSEWSVTRLVAGDRYEIVQFVGGG
jgi:thiamine biosynthesis protein ThiS